MTDQLRQLFYIRFEAQGSFPLISSHTIIEEFCCAFYSRRHVDEFVTGVEQHFHGKCSGVGNVDKFAAPVVLAVQSNPLPGGSGYFSHSY